MTITEKNNLIRRGLEHILEGEKCLNDAGYSNITQPGLLKELDMGVYLQHTVISDKHQADAYDPSNPNDLYEYFTCQENVKNQTFAIDGMASRGPLEKAKSLKRITRNKGIKCGVYNGLRRRAFYDLPKDILVDYVDKNLTRRDKNGTSKNNEHTVNFSLKWVRENGTLIWTNGQTKDTK